MAFIVSQLVSKKEKKDIDKMFRSLDKNGDGKLSKEELNDGLVNFYGAKFEDNEWNDIFK